MARVVTAQIPRPLWVGGLVVAAAAALVALALGSAWPLIVVPFGLLVATFPLIVRVDAVELDGPHLRVRRFVRWVGPVDLRQLVALVYRPRTQRAGAAWLLVQRQTGRRLRAHWRFVIGRETYERLRRQHDLRVVEVGAGSRLAPIPGLADRLAQYVLPTGAIVDERARAALARHAG